MAQRKVTDEQLIEAFKTMSLRQVAEHFGMEQRSIERRKARLALKGWSPEHDMTHIVPDGFKLKGTSSLYKEGVKAPVLQWVKSTTDEQRQRELMQAAIEAMGEDLPRLAFSPAPAACNTDLLNCYVVTDYHLGLLSWHEETGAMWMAVANHATSCCSAMLRS